MSSPAYVDHHCHGVSPENLDHAGFEALISESHAPHIPGCSQFDKPLGLVIRRYCAPVLGLEPFCAPEAYVERRRALGAEEANRRLLSAAGIACLVIDTGHRSDAILDVEQMAETAGARACEVVRIEAVMEEAARNSGSGAELIERFAESLHDRAAGAVGLKSIVAYRSSFAIDQTPPARAEVLAAADHWLAEIGREGWRRLEDPVLLRHALYLALDICAERSFPLQLHVGLGDRDVILHKGDPSVFTPFIEAAEAKGVAITLLHCYPFVREAAWLAEVYPNVYYDVGVVLNFTGPSARRVLAEALEAGPFFKQLYSSDAFGLAELHHLGRVQFENSLKAVLDGWIAEGCCTARDAERITAMITRENARRIYPLPD